MVLWVYTQTWTYLVNVSVVQGSGKADSACFLEAKDLTFTPALP